MGQVRYKDILARLSWSPDQQKRHAETRLHALLEHAATNVPYYEKRIRAHGVTVRDLRRLNDLTILPLTSRADLERSGDAFLARGAQRTECATRCRGAPGKHALHIYLAPEECQTIRAIERRIVESNGLKGRYNSLTVLPPDQIPPPPSWTERLFKGLHRHVSAFETIAEHLRILTQFRPDCFGAPLWTLNRLAQEIRKGHPLGFVPRLLMSWGEPMRQSDRETLRDTFDIAPTDLYQVWEFGPVAAECPKRDGLHVNFDLAHIESLRAGRPVGPGEAGEVVITSLANKTMPLIRYRVGDVAKWKEGPCACGWQGPMLEGVHGRLEHSVRLPSGVVVAARQFEECLDQFTNVVAYRAIQTEPRMVEVLVIPGTLFQERTAQLVRGKCLELFNQQVGVELRMVNELPLLTGNRRQSVICKLPHV
jgi:phenylacetate-CoA ligase